MNHLFSLFQSLLHHWLWHDLSRFLLWSIYHLWYLPHYSHPFSHSSPQVCLMIQSFGSILSFVCVFKKETSLIFLNKPLKWEENFKAFWTSFLRLCVFKTLLSLITLFLSVFLIHQVIGGELQDRLIPIPYSKSTTDQAVREFYNCPVKLLSLYLTLYAWCIPSSKTSIQTPKKCCTFIFSHSTLIPQLYIIYLWCLFLVI